MTSILSFSTTHDSGASLIQDGTLVAAVNEERFNRTKHYGYLPFKSIEYCLHKANIEPADLDAIAVPSDVLRADARLLLNGDQHTKNVSVASSPLRKRAALFAGENAKRLLQTNTNIPEYAKTVKIPDSIPIYCVNHHESHAATAYYCSGYDEAVVITLDGLGDRLSGTVWYANDGEMENMRQWGRAGSLGWFYGIVTQALGWWIGNGEGKTMGLASYTEPSREAMDALRSILPEYDDGELVSGYDFSRSNSWTVHDTQHWSFEEAEYVEGLIEQYGRKKIAASAQALLEEQILEIVQPWLERSDTSNLATAGGIFLNVQVNQRILEDISPEKHFIFPNAGDGGLPTGAALRSMRHLDSSFTGFEMTNAYWGPDITTNVTDKFDERHLSYEKPDDIVQRCVDLLVDGKIIAWCQGRMEYGPRALGNRSILIDPTKDDSMDRVNRRVKFRDSWRPFAPSIIEESVDDYLENPHYDPFMVTSTKVRNQKREEIPAVTHVDDTTRPQVVRKSVNERYWRLIKTFGDRTGTPVLLNTSFNLSGDPIVCTPEDAIQTFYTSGLDALAIGDYLLIKESV